MAREQTDSGNGNECNSVSVNLATAGCRSTRAKHAKLPLDRILGFFFSPFLFFLPFSSTLLSRLDTTNLLVFLGISWCFVAFLLAVLALLALCCQGGHPNADLLGIERRGPIQPGNAAWKDRAKRCQLPLKPLTLYRMGYGKAVLLPSRQLERSVH